MSKLSPVSITRLSAVASPRERGAIGTTITRIEASGAAPAKPDVVAVLRSAGVYLPASADVTALQAGAAKGPMTVAEVDKLLSDLPGHALSREKRIAAKSALVRAGLLK